MESLFELLDQYTEKDIYPVHMPGHKRQSVGDMPSCFSRLDITEIVDFDDLHNPQGILASCQIEAAKMYGAQESFYLVGGSTCGVLTAVSAALPVGGHLLMARNCHQSAYHAAYLRRLRISYLYPKQELHQPCEAILPEQVQASLDQTPGILAVLLVSPTYEGRIADIEKIAHIVHQKGIPLIVDEAHGAHLGLWEGSLPNSCMSQADLVIHSVHKTLPSLTQTALLHINGDLLDRNQIRRFLRIYQSSSPSYLLMAGIDNALRTVRQEGKKRYKEFTDNWNQMLEQLHQMQYLTVPNAKSCKQDIGKLIISTAKINLSARRLYDMLLSDYGVMVEMCSERYILAMFTAWDDKVGFERVTNALLALDHKFGELSDSNSDISYIVDSTIISTEDFLHPNMPLWEAWDLPFRECLLSQSVGKIVADFVGLYPPGIPLLVPGERIRSRDIRMIQYYLENGTLIRGVQHECEQALIKIVQI
ncbi:MAG: PLP-dependent transferase [Lachnospiraceae bacterium]|jgi:arginine/lysine/ornithine decarboxylase|nr:PLP-dependent transferase [Lachnospiraceae bacterium]